MSHSALETLKTVENEETLETVETVEMVENVKCDKVVHSYLLIFTYLFQTPLFWWWSLVVEDAIASKK